MENNLPIGLTRPLAAAIEILEAFQDKDIAEIPVLRDGEVSWFPLEVIRGTVSEVRGQIPEDADLNEYEVVISIVSSPISNEVSAEVPDGFTFSGEVETLLDIVAEREGQSDDTLVEMASITGESQKVSLGVLRAVASNFQSSAADKSDKVMKA